MIKTKERLDLTGMIKTCEKLNYTLSDLPFTDIHEIVSLTAYFYLYNKRTEVISYYYSK